MDKPEPSRLALSLGIGSQQPPKDSRPVADVLGKLKNKDSQSDEQSKGEKRNGR